MSERPEQLYFSSSKMTELLSIMTKRVRTILLSDFRVNLKRSRFEYKGLSVPFKLMAFEGKNWGYCRPELGQVALNKVLFYIEDHQFRDNVIRHEIAHLFTYLDYGPNVMPHGKEFQETCRRFNFDKEVSKASGPPLSSYKTEATASQKYLEKAQKIWSLAQGGGSEESKQAYRRVHQMITPLLGREASYEDLISFFQEKQQEADEGISMAVISSQTRSSPELEALAKILEGLGVASVFNYGHKKVYLEICGTKKDVLLAHQAGHYLKHELKYQWSKAKLKILSSERRKAKGPFMQGLAQGLLETINSEMAQGLGVKAGREVAKAHSLLLESHKEKMYGRLSHKAVQKKDHRQARSLGQSVGRSLKCPKGLKARSQKLLGR